MLRQYQIDIVDKTRALMRSGVKSILIQSPTGSGKTLLTAHMLKTAAAKGMPSWFNVHRRELIKQSTRAFGAEGVHHGIVSAGFEPDLRQIIQIASVGTLARRHAKMRVPRLIVWDECHHIAAKSWGDIYRAIPDAFHIGLTATPERLDGKGLGDYFKAMINGPSVAWLIANGFLSSYRLFSPGGVSVDGLHSRMGDFVRSELAVAADKPSITGNAITHYRKHANGKRAVVFCVSIEHSKHVAAQFNAAGIPAAHVDGETDGAERDASIRAFERGDILVLCNVDLFGEGFDVPAIEAVIDLAPTQSLAKFLQRCGRALRPAADKPHAVILDHAGNVSRHGLPDDVREWSLAGRAQGERDSGGGLSVRVCPACFAAQFSGKPVCGFCGHVFAIVARQVETKEGDLHEVDVEVIRALRRQKAQDQGQAQSFKDLVEVGRKRGYKNPHGWAKIIFNARQAKKLQQGRTA